MSSIDPQSEEITLSPEQFQRLLVRADGGDQEALATVRSIFDQHPEIWREFSDLEKRSEWAMVAIIAARSNTLKDAIQRRLAELKSDLGAANASPLERAVISCVTSCWLQVQFAEAGCVQHSDDDKTDFWQKRLASSQKRYLAAVKALATLRSILSEKSG